MNSETQTIGVAEVRFLNVVFSEKGVSEFAGKRRVVFISRDKIQIIETDYGWQAERPLLQVITSLLLVLLGTGGAVILADGGLAVFRWGVGFLFFGVLGAWLLWQSLRRGYYLRVVCSDDLRKLAIHGRIQKKEFREFIDSAAKLGYDIHKGVSLR